MPRKSTGPDRKTRALVHDRDGWACACCGKHVGAVPLTIQHRTARGMGGSSDPAANSPANLLTLCGSGTTGCHGWTEGNRRWAQENGYSVPRGIDPVSVPVQYHDGSWWLLDATGHRRPSEERAA